MRGMVFFIYFFDSEWFFQVGSLIDGSGEGFDVDYSFFCRINDGFKLWGWGFNDDHDFRNIENFY